MASTIIVDRVSDAGIPDYNFVVLGPTPVLKALPYDTLKSKIGDVPQALLQKAQEKMADGTTNVYLDSFLVTFASVSSDYCKPIA